MRVKTDLNEPFDFYYCCVSLCVIALLWPQLFLLVLLFLWLPFSSVYNREYIWQCCFCFDLLFFPNFPPSLPRALSYSQDIKVIHAKDLIKALLSQNTTTSHSAFNFLWFWFTPFHFIFPVFSFPLTFSLSKNSVFLFSVLSYCVTLPLFFLQSHFFFICLIWFSGYIIINPVSDPHTLNTDETGEDARIHTKMEMHTHTHTQTQGVWLLFCLASTSLIYMYVLIQPAAVPLLYSVCLSSLSCLWLFFLPFLLLANSPSIFTSIPSFLSLQLDLCLVLILTVY